MTGTAEHDAFLLRLSERIRPLRDPNEIMTTAAESLARHLQVAGAGYAEMEDADQMIVGGEFTDGRMPAIKGRLRLSDLGEGFGPVLRAGQGVYSADMTDDPRAPSGGSTTVHAFRIRAAGATPLIKNGRLMACLYATHHEPRPWAAWERAIFEDVAECTWAAVDRSRAERALHESQDKYRAVITSMDEGFLIAEVIFDEAGAAVDYRCLEMNPAFYAQTGLKEDVAGRLMSELFQGTPLPRMPAYADLARSHTPVRFDHEVETDSLRGHYDVHVVPLGEPWVNRVAVLFQNISSRKKREANLAFLAEIQLDLARLTSAEEIMNTVGRKVCSFLKVSYAYFVQVDEAKDEARPRYIWNWENVPPLPEVFKLSTYVTPEFLRMARASEPLIVRDTGDDARTNRDAYAARRMGAFIGVPFVKKGEWRYTLSVCDSAPRDWTTDEIELTIDLANRVFPRMERALAEQTIAEDLRDTRLLRELGAKLVSERDAQALHEEILTAAITLTHADAGTVQLLNPQTQQLSLIATRGFPEHVTRYFAQVDATSGTSCGAALAKNERAFIDFDAPELENVESARLHTELGYRSAQSTPLLTRGGVPLGMVSTHWREPHHRPTERELRFLDLLTRQAADLLDLRRSEDALRARETELKESNRRKDEFIAMLAHELRNPLAPVRSGLEVIRVAGDTRAGVERVRSMMERQVGHMVRLIDDLLDISRITSGKIRLQRQPTDLATLISTAIETNRDAVTAGRIRLVLDVPDGAALIDVDPTRFVQVISNLLQNAVKFTDPDGEVAISARLHTTEGGRGELVVTISDSGVGISKDALPLVFDLFTQGEADSERAKGGLGIGLALSRRLMELHGGSIHAESGGAGKGSAFTVRLPFDAKPAPVAEAPAPPSTARIARRAVVIDDNRDAADATAMLVSVMGGEVRVAYDGESGVREVVSFKPHIVFVDIGMPGIDGFETCRRIRREVGSGITVVALTGWGQDQDKRATKQAGFDVHLTKPADPKVLERLIAEAPIAS